MNRQEIEAVLEKVTNNEVETSILKLNRKQLIVKVSSNTLNEEQLIYFRNVVQGFLSEELVHKNLDIRVQ